MDIGTFLFGLIYHYICRRKNRPEDCSSNSRFGDLELFFDAVCDFFSSRDLNLLGFDLQNDGNA